MILKYGENVVDHKIRYKKIKARSFFNDWKRTDSTYNVNIDKNINIDNNINIDKYVLE